MSELTFNERFNVACARAGNSRLCIGLDTDINAVPNFLRSTDNPVLEFNVSIIKATHDLCCSYKMNLAFYESYGEKGMHALKHTLAHIPAGVLTIGDGKRNDIGNTAQRYADALFDYYGFDAITVNPYMGMDSLKPFFSYTNKCVFVLALTSNPGSADFQRLRIDDTPLYMHVADRCMAEYGGTGQLGFVVGATHTVGLEKVRGLVGKDIPLLLPGIGTQGGDLQEVTRINNGGIALYNVSRAICNVSNGQDFAEQARSAALAFLQQEKAAGN